MSGKIVEILIAKDSNSNMQAVTEAVLEKGKGIFGDKYNNKEDKTPREEVTLIELANITAFNNKHADNLCAKDFRRNIVINNYDLNSLVGKEFYLGNVLLKGEQLCEPCLYLAEKTHIDFLKTMENKCGLRASILKDGNINLDSQLEAI